MSTPLHVRSSDLKASNGIASEDGILEHLLWVERLKHRQGAAPMRYWLAIALGIGSHRPYRFGVSLSSGPTAFEGNACRAWQDK